MRQDFSQVSDERRSELFPIILEPHNPAWSEYYIKEKEFLYNMLGDKIVRISHIGSSSIPGIRAKPIIDILLELSLDTDIDMLSEHLLDEGYVINTPEIDVILYLKGYTPQGFEGQCYHIHVRYSGDWDELYFRDYLLIHPEVAHEYEKLKLALKELYTHDRDAYTDAKGDFIKKYTALAREEFPDRYVPV